LETALDPVLRGPIRSKLCVNGDLYERFLAQSLSTPSKVAIYRDLETISYSEFAASVAALGEQLKAAGIKAQDRVAIQIARSPSFVLSVFAVMSVGGVFVPLSEDDPPARTQAICANVGTSALLRMNSKRNAVIMERHVNKVGPLFPGTSKEISYILHTSGSTGVPKGVAIDRTALANCLSWHVDKFHVDDTSVVSHLNLTSFDFIIAEVLLPFLVGAAMAIPTASVSSDVVGVIKALSFADVSLIQLVPTLLGRFLRALSSVPNAQADLRAFKTSGHMICNGEALPDSMRRTFYKLFPESILHNCYGPTEACVGVTEYQCPTMDSPQTMYIGTPVPNVTLFICDNALRATPNGDIGELLIGGAQVGLGYVGNPSETAKKFLHIETSEGSSLVYRTGDLVRLASGRVIEFMGRADTQVKFRSLRLELGEIEAAAQRSGLCDEAKAIVTSANESDDRQELLLFVTPSTVPLQMLKRYLSDNLPKDRRPSSIIHLDMMPATERGKLDRERLISIYQSHRSSGERMFWESNDSQPNAPNPLESLLRSISEVTHRQYLAEDLWPVAGLDSLARIDLNLALLEKGFEFRSHLCESHGITLQKLSEDLESIQQPSR
jgi:amino acid adenylation domain-containing protein